ncbi:MAG: alpha/beta hydrolase [Hyphomicrobiales bacterium]|nr:alpha/beta hydrolase [Hyphomicrobiales bacterium]
MGIIEIMLHGWIRSLFAVVCVTMLSGPVKAEDVAIEVEGLTVLGNLEMAPGKSLQSDGVVILLHDTLTHNRMEILSALQELLRENGQNTLSITLSLGLNERRGLYNCAIEQDHRNEDAAIELASWVNWLKSQGASNITLAGHGRGGNQVAVYAAKSPDPAVKKLVLIAPIADSPATLEQQFSFKFRQSLQPILAQAQKYVDEGDATKLLVDVPFLSCPRAKVTSAAFVNYYGANQNLYTPSILPHIAMPILVVVGDLDPLSNEIIPAVEGIPGMDHIKLDVIPGADNFFRDLAADDLAARMSGFFTR